MQNEYIYFAFFEQSLGIIGLFLIRSYLDSHMHVSLYCLHRCILLT